MVMKFSSSFVFFERFPQCRRVISRSVLNGDKSGQVHAVRCPILALRYFSRMFIFGVDR